MKLLLLALIVLTSAVTPTTPRTTGDATHCKPTPRYCTDWGPPAMVAAVPSFRWGDKPYRVRVSYKGRSVTVTVVSFCACGSAIIDLSIHAFRQLANEDLGRITVSVTPVGRSGGSGRSGPIPTIPPTDTDG